ncbi:hypothetical protein SAMN05216282_10147 [Cryobacterium psychrotolerans]|uniref:Uncharacterized protein n=1 Tax=Cryobacterium psychrotolerans TaxID=386301 RepID=A0A1G8X0K3_9MICO|nr:hypothetical protein SAMN05216282_10147 [Cryobacterium psychrotolerans]
MLGGSALYLAMVGLLTGGPAGFLLVVGVTGLVTASYALLTGRRSWALLPSPGVAAASLAACLILTSFGAALSHPGDDDLDLAANSSSSAASPETAEGSRAEPASASDSAAASSDSASESESATAAPAPPAETTIDTARVAPPIIAERTVIGTAIGTRGTIIDAAGAAIGGSAMTLLDELPAKNACRSALPSPCRIPD